MKKIFSLILFLVFIISCDDGDLIVTEFSFENQQLRHCNSGETQVLYNVNNDDTNESIAFIFSMSEEDFLQLETPTEIALNAQNRIVYRTFDSAVDAYYCTEIPPASPVVVTEYQSTSGGTVTFTPVLKTLDDHDGDGVPSSIEMGDSETDFPDTDGDGIPDYLDIDDDNDNVRTSDEINASAQNSLDRYFDTDGDGIPDYLDPDDDGDGTPTRNEDLDQNGDPTNDRNDEGLANYLNPEILDSFPADTYLTNTISQSYRIEVIVQNLTLQNQRGDGEEITMIKYILGYFDTPANTITLPEDGDDATEEEPEAPEEENPETEEGTSD